jgi:RNA polymerase sigma-70 factor, ECF subfamily
MAQPRHIGVAAPQLTTASDADLVLLARHGSAAAFRGIMERNNRRLFRVARSLVRTMPRRRIPCRRPISVLLPTSIVTPGAALSTWLTRIALNEALGRLRRRRSMVEFDDDRAEFDAGADEAGACVMPFPLTQSTMPASRTRSSAPI